MLRPVRLPRGNPRKKSLPPSVPRHQRELEVPRLIESDQPFYTDSKGRLRIGKSAGESCRIDAGNCTEGSMLLIRVLDPLHPYKSLRDHRLGPSHGRPIRDTHSVPAFPSILTAK